MKGRHHESSSFPEPPPRNKNKSPSRDPPLPAVFARSHPGPGEGPSQPPVRSTCGPRESFYDFQEIPTPIVDISRKFCQIAERPRTVHQPALHPQFECVAVNTEHAEPDQPGRLISFQFPAY